MLEQNEQKTNLLQPVDTTMVGATSAPFAVRENFKASSGVKFSTIWNEFKRRFFGKVEQPVGEVRLRKYKLVTIAPDGPIIAELGGAAKAEGSIAAAFALIRRQATGEAGFLQTNGYANIFYVRDEKGVLCAVRIGWDGEGWVVDAISVEDPLAWNGKHEIFCPVSDVETP
jgi:hypothetical protein